MRLLGGSGSRPAAGRWPDMNYVMSGWPGRDPPRGGSEGPAPMVDRAPVRGPAGPGKGRWFGSVFHRTLPAGVGLLRVRRQGHHPPGCGWVSM